MYRRCELRKRTRMKLEGSKVARSMPLCLLAWVQVSIGGQERS